MKRASVTRKIRNRRGGEDTPVAVPLDKCSVHFCEKIFLPKVKKMMAEVAETTKRVLSANINKTQGKRLTAQQRGMLKSTLKNTFDKTIMLKKCQKVYCNPDCKGTLFEAGSKVPASLIATIKKEFVPVPVIGIVTKELKVKKINREENAKQQLKAVMKGIKVMREMVFKGKTNVLKDHFFEGLTDDEVKEWKTQGATSGCTLFKMF